MTDENKLKDLIKKCVCWVQKIPFTLYLEIRNLTVSFVCSISLFSIRYSEFITFPIFLETQTSEEVEVPLEDTSEEDEAASDEDKATAEAKAEDSDELSAEDDDSAEGGEDVRLHIHTWETSMQMNYPAVFPNPAVYVS